MANFIVREPSRGPSSLSDHSPIMAWFNIGTNDNHLATTNTNDTLTRLPKQFIWESNSPQKLRAALQSRDIQRMIHDFLLDSGPDRNINTSLDAVESIILTTAKRCLKIKVIKKRHLRLPANKKWFDKDCRLKRHALRKLANLKHRDPLNIMLREKYHTESWMSHFELLNLFTDSALAGSHAEEDCIFPFLKIYLTFTI